MEAKSGNLTRFAWLALAAAVLTMALKAIAYSLTGSVGLLSDALESLVNLVAALMALARMWTRLSRLVCSSLCACLLLSDPLLLQITRLGWHAIVPAHSVVEISEEHLVRGGGTGKGCLQRPDGQCRPVLLARI
jgi:hypothetical protein